MRGYAAIGLYATKTDANVGGVLRAVSCYDAAMVAIEGKRYKRMNTDTTAAFRHVPLIHAPLEVVMPFDCVPLCIELCDGATPLTEYRHPERAFYIFGPEDGSVPVELQKKCRDRVFIPTKFCMNLAATVNVVLYDRMQKETTHAD